MLTGGEGSTTWFTSDLHLGHPLVSGIRGFGEDEAGVARHDETLLGNLSDTLKEEDHLWILGDISSGWEPQEEAALDKIQAALKGDDMPRVYLHLVSGNHDSTHPLHTHAYLRQRRFLEVFDSVQSMQNLLWEGHTVWLNHFPRPGQDHIPGGSRHDELRLDVPWMLHGHLHSPTPITGVGQVDVGVDPWGFKPVVKEELMETLMASGRA